MFTFVDIRVWVRWKALHASSLCSIPFLLPYDVVHCSILHTLGGGRFTENRGGNDHGHNVVSVHTSANVIHALFSFSHLGLQTFKLHRQHYWEEQKASNHAGSTGVRVVDEVRLLCVGEPDAVE